MRKRLGWSLVALSLAGGVWALGQPLPYVIIKPGPVFNVLGSDNGTPIIGVTSTIDREIVGSIDLLTVSAFGSPGNTPSLLEILQASANSEFAVRPLESVFPAGSSLEEVQESQKADFYDAEQTALAAASTILSQEQLEAAVIDIRLTEVGGPSGGLALTLGIIEKLTPDSLTGGKRIAATGTIDSEGKVGAIGGIRQKMFAAWRNGDKFLLLPKANCDELAGLRLRNFRVVPVGSLAEAINALKIISADGEPSKLAVCSGD